MKKLDASTFSFFIFNFSFLIPLHRAFYRHTAYSTGSLFLISFSEKETRPDNSSG